MPPTGHAIALEQTIWGEPVPHAALLHRDARGYIALCRRTEDLQWLQRFLGAPEFLAAAATASGQPDTYASQNTFSRPCRRVDALRQLRTLFVDLDCYRVGLAPPDALDEVLERALADRIPWPSAVLQSGRGLAPLWLLRAAPAAALPRWAALQSFLLQALADLGADARASDPARVLRVAGSVHGGTGAAVRLIEYRQPPTKGALRYELADLARQYLPEAWHTSARFPAPNTEPGDAPRPRKVAALFNAYTLHLARLEDLNRLAERRNWDLRGRREVCCFLWRYWSCCVLSDPEEGLRQTLSFNAQFREPLDEREVRTATRSAEKAWAAWVKARAEGRPPGRKGDPLDGYNYSNAALIELLGITATEQRNLKTIIGAAERRRRKNQRRSAGRWHQIPQQIRLCLLRQAMEAHPGATQRELAEMLGWGKGSVDRARRALKEGARSGQGELGCARPLSLALGAEDVRAAPAPGGAGTG